MADYSSIQATPELLDELAERKQRGESYEDVIWRLIDEADRDGDRLGDVDDPLAQLDDRDHEPDGGDGEVPDPADVVAEVADNW